MHKRIKNILSFHCPAWDELPEKPMFNQEVVDYVQSVLDPLMEGKVALTPTMIQNYSKWGAIPKIPGRKYGKEQIAILLTIAIYKQVLPIDQVREGVELQVKNVSIDKSFDIFSETMNTAIQRIFKNAGQKLYELESVKFLPNTEGIQAVSYAFAAKLLATLIIDLGGYKKLGEKHE